MTRVGAIDVGTNSVRLLVADEGAPLRALEREMVVTRLGQGIDASGHLDDAALQRTLDQIEGYFSRAEELGATSLRITATSAVRDAQDRDRFFDGVRARTGHDAEVLTGEEEAHTSFTGAVSSVQGVPPWLVVDIGGGSTEFIFGGDTPELAVSRQLGCVRLAERFGLLDVPGDEALEAARLAVDEHLEAVVEVLDPKAAATLVGVAGTVTTLGALYLDLPAYEPDRIHGTRLPAPAIADLTRRLGTMTNEQRRALGPMAPGREDVILAGSLILQRIVERYGFSEVLVSEADILDGLVLSLLQPQLFEEIDVPQREA